MINLTKNEFGGLLVIVFLTGVTVGMLINIALREF